MPETQNFTETKKRRNVMYRDIKIMLKMTDLLFQEKLITPEEKSRMIQIIRKEEGV